MKANILVTRALYIIFFIAIPTISAYAQCEPMSPEECPDPENNGQVCPDVMPDGYLNLPYAEEATILAPSQDSTGIVLHHITLQEVGNLPPGISWESNAPNNEFMAGQYYCIVLQGTPTVADTFDLKIVIDIYIDFLGQPVYVMQVVDSTSLSMIIREEFGLDEPANDITLIENYPNPFNEQTNFHFTATESSAGYFEIYSMQGIKVYSQELDISKGKNDHAFEGNLLSPGTYCYVIRSKNTVVSGLIVKTD